MAKRRNLKKEKIERNKAYARQFRKSYRGSTKNRGGYNSSRQQDNHSARDDKEEQ